MGTKYAREFVTDKYVFDLTALEDILTSLEVTLFFAKALELSVNDRSRLIRAIHKTDLIDELLNGEHSIDLQDYGIDDPDNWVPTDEWVDALPVESMVPDSEFLLSIFDDIKVVIASTFVEFTTMLAEVMDAIPSDQAQLMLEDAAKLNYKTNTFGTTQVSVAPIMSLPNALILDDSGSVTRQTFEALVSEYVAVANTHQMHVILVSNTARHFAPEEVSVANLMSVAQFGGTHYEELIRNDILGNMEWGTVITIADYDSSPAAAQVLQNARGRIGLLLDLSLVNRRTYLSEVIGHLADDFKQVLVGAHGYPLGA